MVTIRVTIQADGAPKDVEMLRDPGHGFAEEARRCALGKRWSPALDYEGRPVEVTMTVNARFDR